MGPQRRVGAGRDHVVSREIGKIDGVEDRANGVEIDDRGCRPAAQCISVCSSHEDTSRRADEERVSARGADSASSMTSSIAAEVSR